MSWGIYYTYRGYLLRHTLDQLNSDIEECKEELRLIQNKLTALAASTPPPNMLVGIEGGDDDDTISWQDHVVYEVNNLLNEYAEAVRTLKELEQIAETQTEHPDDVKQG